MRNTAIMRDGRSVSHDVRIQAITGEVQPLRIGPRGDLPPTFGQQLRTHAALPTDQVAPLVRILFAAE